MRTIRASEISAYIFCRRAWWYQQQGLESQNLSLMEQGTQLHYRHGRAQLLTGLLRFLAYGLILLTLALLAAHFIGRLL